MSSAQYSYKRDPKLPGYPNITNIPNELINRIDSAVRLAVRELDNDFYTGKVQMINEHIYDVKLDAEALADWLGAYLTAPSSSSSVAFCSAPVREYPPARDGRMLLSYQFFSSYLA